MQSHELPLSAFIFTASLLRKVLAFGVAIGKRPEEKETKKYICLTFFFSGKKMASIFSGPFNIFARTEGLFLRPASDNNLMLS